MIILLALAPIAGIIIAQRQQLVANRRGNKVLENNLIILEKCLQS